MGVTGEPEAQVWYAEGWSCLEAGEDCFAAYDAQEEDDVFYSFFG